MSKVIKLDEEASVQDGKMEIYQTEYVSVTGLLRLLLSASIKGIAHIERTDSFSFKTVRRTLVQLDGEVFTLDAASPVTITCEYQLLRTIV